MPRFHHKKMPLKAGKKKRTFLVPKVKKVTKKKIEVVKLEEIRHSEAANKEVVNETNPKMSWAPPQEVEINVKREDNRYEDKDHEEREIERMIRTSADRIKHMEETSVDEDLGTEDEPDVFDGISNEEERLRLMEAKLQAEQRRAARIKHEMELVKAEFEKEKEKLEKHVRELRKEIRGKAPVEETQFFSLSKELKVAVDAIEKLVDRSEVDNGAKTEDTKQMEVALREEPSQQNQTQPNEVRRIVTNPAKPESYEGEKTADQAETIGERKKAKVKKLLITGGAVVAVVLVSGGVLSMTLFSQPEVDDNLVKEYLEQNVAGDVAGSSTTSNAGQEAPTVTTASAANNNEFDALTKEVAFEESEWEKFTDGIFGIEMEYPKNAVKILKTDSSVTFSRKDGYIFRIQLTETALKLSDYWNQVKATTYNYEVEEVTFKENEALKLTLTEETAYPGDKYLVKVGDKIYDLWYATPSDKFSQDDILRANRMLEKIIFLNKDNE